MLEKFPGDPWLELVFSLLGPCSTSSENQNMTSCGAAHTPPHHPPKNSIPSFNSCLTLSVAPIWSKSLFSFTWISSVLSCCLPAATHFFFLLYFYFIGVWLLYNVVLASTIWHCESATSVCVCVCVFSLLCLSPTPPLLHPTPEGHHRAPSCAPCAIQHLPTGYLFLSVYKVYVSMLLFCIHPTPLSPSPIKSTIPVSTSVWLCPEDRFINTIFLSIYIH